MRRFALLCSLMLMLVGVFGAAAQEGDVSAFGETLDATLPALMAESGVPGAAVVAFRDGEIIFAQAYGLADPAADVPATLDTPFPVWSISKALTAFATLRLVEGELMALDAPVTDYLTRWEFPTSRFDLNEITIERILSHMAGLSVDGYDTFAPDDPLPTLEAFLSGEGGDAVRVIGPAGLRFSYSGGGFTVLQLAIEEVTGLSFSEFMQGTFDALGMRHSSYVWSPELGAAVGFTRNGEASDRPVHMDQAAGGLYASANDLATFFMALMPAGDESAGRGLITPEHAALMFTGREEADGEYGLGVFVMEDENGETLVWHDGLGHESKSIFMLRPSTGEGIVLVTNAFAGDDLFDPTLCAWAAMTGVSLRMCG